MTFLLILVLNGASYNTDAVYKTLSECEIEGTSTSIRFQHEYKDAQFRCEKLD